MIGFAADLLLFAHFAFVLFLVGGLALVWMGGWRQWTWVRNRWFPIAHLCAIGVVVAQSSLGILCPLTRWEMQLREKVGESTYEGSFLSHWLGQNLYIEAPWEAFLAAYTIFGLLVLSSLFLVPPRWSNRRKSRRRPEEKK